MMAQYFIFSVGTLWRNNLHYIKAFSDQKPPLDAVLLICISKANTFFFCNSASTLVRAVHEKTRNITAYILFLCLSDQDNCKHMKRIIGKQIVFVLLHQICFVLHHSICMLLIHWQSLAIIGCFRLQNFTWAETQHFLCFDIKEKNKHKVISDNTAGVAPTQQYLFSSHKHEVAWSVQWKEKLFTPCKFIMSLFDMWGKKRGGTFHDLNPTLGLHIYPNIQYILWMDGNNPVLMVIHI